MWKAVNAGPPCCRQRSMQSELCRALRQHEGLLNNAPAPVDRSVQRRMRNALCLGHGAKNESAENGQASAR